MDTVLIIVSFAVLAALILLLIRGYNATVVLSVLGCACILVMQYVNGTSILGEAGTGSFFFDTFGYIAEVFQTQFTSTIITIIIVLGYVSVLDKISASSVFSVALANSLRKIRSRNLMLALVLVLSVIVKWAVPSAITTFLLLVSTVYPVLRAIGCTSATAVTSLLVCSSFPLGPNQPFTAMLFGGYSNMPEVTAPTWFLQHELRYIVPTMVVAVVVFIISSRVFDRSETAKSNTDDIGEIQEAKEYGVPMFYAAFPILPLFLVLLLGGTITAIPVKASVASIYFCCLFGVIIIDSIRTGKVKTAFDLSSVFFQGMGTAFAQYGTIIVAGALFSDGLSQIGGMGLLMNRIVESGFVSGEALVIAGCVIALVLNALSGNMAVGFFPLAAIFSSMISAGAVDPYMAYSPLVAIAAMGTTLSLTSPPSLVAAEKTGIPVVRIVIRMIPTIVAAAAALLITCTVLYS